MSLSDIQPYKALPFHGVILPTITISSEDRAAQGVAPEATNLEFLTQLCRNGFKKRAAKGLIPKERHAEYAERVKMELGVISELGFVDYIVMVRDICRFADEKQIPRGPGRGSVAGSLVCHLAGITALDPIQHGLFFTRFLSKSRAKSTMVDGVRYIDGSLVPDVDMDFSYYRRQEILDYLVQRYPGQTSKLLTTTTLTSKALIKDVLKVYEGANEDQANAASDLIDKVHGIPEELEDALNGDAKWLAGDEENGRPPNERFAKWAQDHKETVDVAMDLTGLNRGEGVHASALLICAYPIRQLMPLQLTAEKDEVSGYDMYSGQEIVLKFDILGLKTLDVIHDVCTALKLDRDALDVNDPSIYRYLQDFKQRYGIFQLETFAQGNAAANVRPMNFEQLSAVLAIARPGAFAYINQYCKYLHEGAYNSVHPLVDDILRPTGGVCLYQEQFLAMLIKVGLTSEEAENARRVLGKKDVKKVPETKAKITEVCARNGHPSEIVDLLQKIAEDSGGYSFNLSHAASYAMITAWSVYLKTNHPLHFYWALLRMAAEETDGHEIVATIETEMRSHGYQLLPPHLVESTMDFRIVDGRSIRFSLGMLRGIAEKNMGKLAAFQTKVAGERLTKFRLFESIKQCGLSVGIGAALIQAGCMDGYDEYISKAGLPYKSRSRLTLEILTWNILTEKEKALCIAIADKPEVAHDVQHAILYLRDNLAENGKPYLRAATAKMGGRYDTIHKAYAPYKEIYEMNRRNEALANFFYERRILGYSHSQTLRGIFGEHIDGLSSVADALEAPKDEKMRLIGFVKEIHSGKTKKGNDSLRWTLSDETGSIKVSAFNDAIAVIEQTNGRLLEDEDLVIVKIKIMDGGSAFVDSYDGCPVAIQTAAVYTKLSELRAKGDAKEESNSA